MAASSQQENKSQAEAIRKVYREISSALSEKRLEDALLYFSDSEEMTKISNGRLMRGKQEMAAYWSEGLGDVVEISVTIENISIHYMDSGHAWATADEVIQIDGRTTQALVSNIFVLTTSGWKILLDHTTYLD